MAAMTDQKLIAQEPMVRADNEDDMKIKLPDFGNNNMSITAGPGAPLS